jgi:hypothetical protein
MPLTSLILAGNARLDQAAAGGPSVKVAPPPDDPDAVRRIQRALLALGFPMPISFPAGPNNDPDGKFGHETFQTVIAFQRKVFPSDPKQWDGRVGPLTLAKMDEQLPKGVAPPPQPQGLFNTKDAERAITAYLVREMRRDVVALLTDHPANLIVFGETHFTFDAGKALLLSELVFKVRQRRPINTNFHASERWTNDTSTRQKISDFLRAPPAQQGTLMFQLGGDLLPFAPVLVQAANFPDRRYGILPINTIQINGEDPRHEALFSGFVDSASRCPDVPFGSINSTTSRGNILLGARHAARLHVSGHAAQTTCGRLIGAGWKAHAVRLTVTPDPADPRGSFFQDDLKMVLRRGAADHTPIDVLKIAQSISGGKPFYADLTKNDSPFVELRDGDANAADIAFNKLFDALLHIPLGTSSFPG